MTGSAGPGVPRTDTERLEWMVRVGADFCYSSRMEVHFWGTEEDGDQSQKFADGGRVIEHPTQIAGLYRRSIATKVEFAANSTHTSGYFLCG